MHYFMHYYSFKLFFGCKISSCWMPFLIFFPFSFFPFLLIASFSPMKNTNTPDRRTSNIGESPQSENEFPSLAEDLSSPPSTGLRLRNSASRIPTSKDWSPFLSTMSGASGSEPILTFPEIATTPNPTMSRTRKRDATEMNLHSPSLLLAPEGLLESDHPSVDSGSQGKQTKGSSRKGRSTCNVGNALSMGTEVLSGQPHPNLFSFGGNTTPSRLAYNGPYKLDLDTPMSPHLDLGILDTEAPGVGMPLNLNDEDSDSHMGSSGTTTKRRKERRGGSQLVDSGDFDLIGSPLPGSNAHYMTCIQSPNSSNVSSGSGSSSRKETSPKDPEEIERRAKRQKERAVMKEQKLMRTHQARQDAAMLTERARNNLRMRGGPLDGALAQEMLHESNPFGSPPGVRPASDNISPHEVQARLEGEEVHCNCRKTHCLKLYCDCFRKQYFCTGTCHCTGCENNVNFETPRTAAISLILERNPDAFKPRVEPIAEVNGPASASHMNGCRCKKSACLKKYCECYTAAVLCGDKCRCLNCRNVLEVNQNSQ